MRIEDRGRAAPIRLGVAGLGRAFTLLLPTLAADPRVRLVAATDPRAEAMQRFVADFGGRAHASFDALADDPDVEAIYLATPHPMHAEQVVAATRRGKHVFVEKPIAVTLDECDAMIEAAERAAVQLIVGPSHGFDPPVTRARALIERGAYGAVRMIEAIYHTDFLYRPRRPEELDSGQGGGVVWSQGAHQVDVVRLLGGGRVHGVRAMTGRWDRSRPTEGAYAALLTFDDGAFASLVYSGYAHFDGDLLCDGIGEMGLAKDAKAYGAARRNLAKAADAATEAAQKQARNYGGTGYAPPAADLRRAHAHFGFVLACCERADLRITPHGVTVYGDDAVSEERIPLPDVPRAEVLDELWGALRERRAPVHDGRWSKATLEVCLAILESARTGREVTLAHQVAVGGGA